MIVEIKNLPGANNNARIRQCCETEEPITLRAEMGSWNIGLCWQTSDSYQRVFCAVFFVIDPDVSIGIEGGSAFDNLDSCLKNILFNFRIIFS